MEKLIFTRTGDNEYRATITGSLLQLAQRESVSIPIEDADLRAFKRGETQYPFHQTRCVNLHDTPWLNTTVEVPKGLWGSITAEHFDANEIYLVYYKPMSTPPHLFAIKLPI